MSVSVLLIVSTHHICRVSLWCSLIRCRSVTRALCHFLSSLIRVALIWRGGSTVKSIYHYLLLLFERLSTPFWYYCWCPSWTVWSILWSRNVAWTSRKCTQTEDTSQQPPIQKKTKNIFLFFYHFFCHFCWMTRPLKRMTVGMVLASIAFICAAVVQLEIDVSRTVFYNVPTTQLSWFDVKFMLLLCFSRKLCQPSRPPQRLSWD